MLPIRVAVVLVMGVFSVNVLAQEQSAANVMAVKAAVDAYRQDREADILGDFVDLLSIRNVATSLPDMERNADHIIGLLEPRGFKTQRLSAGGAPYIYAELNTPGATETILIYAHFDGQPVQEENWAFPNPLRIGFIFLCSVWVKLFGSSFYTLAHLSFLSYLLFIAINYYFCRRFFDKEKAILEIIHI